MNSMGKAVRLMSIYEASMFNSSSLTGQTTALHCANDVKFVFTIGDFKRLIDNHLQNRTGKICVNRLFIGGDIAFTRHNPYAGNSILSLTCCIRAPLLIARGFAFCFSNSRGRCNSFL